jgi:hypothetical protein
LKLQYRAASFSRAHQLLPPVGVPTVATALGGLAEGAEPTITYGQLGAQDFEPIPSFVGFSSDKDAQQKLENFGSASV